MSSWLVSSLLVCGQLAYFFLNCESLMTLQLLNDKLPSMLKEQVNDKKKHECSEQLLMNAIKNLQF